MTETTTNQESLISAIEAETEKEASMIDKLLLVQRLKRLGFKPGDCGYCGAKTERDREKVGLLVYVKRLPNKVNACFVCYDRGER